MNNDIIKTEGRFKYEIYDRMDQSYKRFLFKTLSYISQKVALSFLRKNAVFIGEYSTKNTITNVGKAQFALLIGDPSAVPFGYIGVGSSNTAPAASQTALGSEITTNGFARVAGTVSRITTAVTNDTYQITTTWTASGTSTIEEVGVFTAVSAGVMGGRALTGSKTMLTGQTLVGVYTIQFS